MYLFLMENEMETMEKEEEDWGVEGSGDGEQDSHLWKEWGASHRR